VHSASYYGKEVAVKELMVAPLDEKEKAIVFVQAEEEVRMLSELHHPAIVRLIGTSTNDSTGRLLIVTERCDMDLKEFLNSQPQCVGRRDFETWHSLMMQICGGMAFLHDHGIIHRDLKPGNCLVNLPDQIRICDFGLSVRTKLKELDETHTGYAGTPLYMAPEVMMGPIAGVFAPSIPAARAIDGSDAATLPTPPECEEAMAAARYSSKVDIFSFGVLMYQCWTGTRPYEEVRGPLWSLQRHIIEGGRPSWGGDQDEEREIMGTDSDDENEEEERKRSKALEQQVKVIASKCWAQNPADRPSFHEAILMLEDIWSNFGDGYDQC